MYYGSSEKLANNINVPLGCSVSIIVHLSVNAKDVDESILLKDEQCTCILHEKYQKIAVFQALLVQNMMTLQSTLQTFFMKIHADYHKILIPMVICPSSDRSMHALGTPMLCSYLCLLS